MDLLINCMIGLLLGILLFWLLGFVIMGVSVLAVGYIPDDLFAGMILGLGISGFVGALGGAYFYGQ